MAENLGSSAGLLDFTLASYVSLAHTPAPSHSLDDVQGVHLMAEQDFDPTHESPIVLRFSTPVLITGDDQAAYSLS